MKIKKTIGILSLLALGSGLLSCGFDVGWGQLLYQGKKGDKEVKYWKSSFSHVKDTSRFKEEYNLTKDDYVYRNAYTMELKMPNGDKYTIKDMNVDEKITLEGGDKVTFTPKDDKSYFYDNSTHLGRLMLEKADKMYQENLKDIKEDLLNK